MTASMKQWLLEIRNVSTQVGKLALDSMEARTRRWRARRDKDPMLRLSRVGSAVEMVTYEKTECKLIAFFASENHLIDFVQIMYWITIKSKWISNLYTNVYIFIRLSTRWTSSANPIKLTARFSLSL